MNSTNRKKMIRLIVIIIIAGASFMFNAMFTSEYMEERELMIQNAVMKILEEAHFDPEDINNEFSEKVFDYYLEYIDPYKRFYTQEDVKSLEMHRLQIDDQVRANELIFFDASVEIMQNRIKEVQDYYKQIIQQDFDFSLNESYELDAEKRNFPANSAELKDSWRRGLKYEIITKMARKIEQYKEREEQKTIDEIEKESVAEVKENFDDWFKRFNQQRRSDRFGRYLNSFTHIFDPHSDYLSPKEKQDFDISMGGKLEGIGARLSKDGDLTKVVYVVPGGPVWRDKQIVVNDHILKVKQEKEEEAVDIFGMRLDDVVQLIRGKKGTVVTLTIKKNDGSITDINLVRDIVNTQESLARSAIIDIPGVIENVGYIHLPKFYSSFEGKDGNSCAVDVRKELIKLNANNAQGIILDLRNNGGGSLRDVVDMSGLFIEKGPIVQVKPRSRSPFVYKDDDPRVIYTGPFVVMINGFSASASEILAAAMQDYDRAVIVGSKSFGKGTVQRFIDLDRTVRGYDEFKPLGELKVTMQKFYRINGGSTQLRGVEPDIVLPDRYAHLDVGEREYDYAMKWTSIDPLSYQQAVLVEKHKDELRMRSESRLLKNSDFNLIKDQAEYLKKRSDETSYPLTVGAYQEVVDIREMAEEKYDKIMKSDLPNFNVSNLQEDYASINLDKNTAARNVEWINYIKKDIYIAESINIVKDMIDLYQ